MDYKSIIDNIKSTTPGGIFFLHGEEPYFIDNIISKIEHEILNEGEKSFNQVVLYGRETEFKQVVDNARQFPMMAEKRVVVLKEAQFMRDFDKLISYFEKPSPHTILAIAYKKKIDKRKKVFKSLASKSISFESKPIYENQLPQWIDKYVRSKGKLIHPQSALILANMTGTNLSKVVNELEKLSIHVKEGEEIKEELVYEQIGMSKEFNIFELQKAFSTRDLQKALFIADNFAKNIKENPIPRVISTLNGYFQKICLAKAFLQLGDVEFARKVGIYSPKFAAEYKNAARLYSYDEMKQFFTFLLEADKKSKGVGQKSPDPYNLLFDLIYNIVSFKN